MCTKCQVKKIRLLNNVYHTILFKKIKHVYIPTDMAQDVK